MKATERVIENKPKQVRKGAAKTQKATEAFAQELQPAPRVTDDFVIVQRDEYHVALKAPIDDVYSGRNTYDRFQVTGFFIHAWRDSARERTISIQAHKQRRVGTPFEAVTTIKTDDPRVAAALRKALTTIGVE